jgi:hypothetical protein
MSRTEVRSATTSSRWKQPDKTGRLIAAFVISLGLMFQASSWSVAAPVAQSAAAQSATIGSTTSATDNVAPVSS